MALEFGGLKVSLFTTCNNVLINESTLKFSGDWLQHWELLLLPEEVSGELALE